MANDVQVFNQKHLKTEVTDGKSLKITEDARKYQKIEAVLLDWALKCADMDIKSNVQMPPEKIDLLKKIHVLSINYALTLPEVQRDPRKISYMANEELKMGLAAILLSHVLTHSLSKARYTREYLFNNIFVYVEDDGSAKHVNFAGIEHSIVQDAIYPEIVYDWIIYRQPDGRKINALSDEKTHYQGLKNFQRGLSPISEFSRFERKLFEDRQKKIQDQKEATQQAFRDSFVQQIAIATAKQLMENSDPIQIANQLFAAEDYAKAIENILSNQSVNGKLKPFSEQNMLQSRDFSKSTEKFSLSPNDDEISLDEVLRDIKSLQNSHER